jgi:DNA primase
VADELDLIRQRIDIVELIGQRMSLKKAGKYWKGLCPFHDDKDPSLTINQQLGRYKCWACGASGDIFNWVMETQRVDFKDALNILADQAGVQLKKANPKERSEREIYQQQMAAAQAFFRAQVEQSETARTYCDNRGLTKEVRDAWGLGYSPNVGEALAHELAKKKMSLSMAEKIFLVKNDTRGGYFDIFRGRLMVPIHDDRGKLVAYGGRIIGDGQPKYINSSDTPLFKKSRILYGMNRAKEAIREADQAVLVEGYMDVIACHMAGVKNAVANLGTAFTDEHAGLLKRWCSHVVILYDRDRAGQDAAMKTAATLIKANLKPLIAMPPEGDDPDSLLQRDGARAVMALVERAVSPMEQRLQLLRERLNPNKDEFWEEAAEALAIAATPMELERGVSALAGDLPGVSDRMAAMDMLRRMAVKAKRGQKAEERKASRAEEAPRRPKAAPVLTGLEKTVLKALVNPLTASSALAGVCGREPFHSPAAKALGESLAEVFPDGLPDEPVNVWIGRLPADAADMLMSIDESVGGQVTEEDLEAALTRLEANKQRAIRRQMLTGEADDETLKKISDQLRETKGW